jgi:hypothetical protein
MMNQVLNLFRAQVSTNCLSTYSKFTLCDKSLASSRGSLCVVSRWTSKYSLRKNILSQLCMQHTCKLGCVRPSEGISHSSPTRALKREHTTTRAGRKVIVPSRFILHIPNSLYVTSLWHLHGEACAWFLGELVNIPCGKISCHNCACNMLHILHFHCGRCL